LPRYLQKWFSQLLLSRESQTVFWVNKGENEKSFRAKEIVLPIPDDL
jgi:hypothetical protein